MKKCSTLALAALAASIFLTGCAGPVDTTSATPAAETAISETVEPKDNTDPRKGWVVVVDLSGYPVTSGGPYKDIPVIKRCDGTTLLYVAPGAGSGAHGITSIENSPECHP